MVTTMLNAIPALTTAMRDRSIRGHPREVYLWLHERLDVVEYRVVKHAAIERDLGLRDSTVSHAIKLLRARGYIQRGPRAYVQKGPLRASDAGGFGRGPWMYRLFHSVAPGDAAAAGGG